MIGIAVGAHFDKIETSFTCTYMVMENGHYIEAGTISQTYKNDTDYKIKHNLILIRFKRYFGDNAIILTERQ